MLIIPFESEKSPKEIFESLKMLIGENFTVLDGSKPYTYRQIFLAYIMAKRAFARRKNISKSLGLEMLLYLSGTRQIREAIKIFGYKGGKGVLVLWNTNNDEHILEIMKKITTLIKGSLIKPNIDYLVESGYSRDIAKRYTEAGLEELLMLELLTLLEVEES